MDNNIVIESGKAEKIIDIGTFQKQLIILYKRFSEILTEMWNLLLDCGLQELEQLSIPSTNERPTPQSNQFLRENWKMIADKYYRELGFDTKSCREQFEIIFLHGKKRSTTDIQRSSYQVRAA